MWGKGGERRGGWMEGIGIQGGGGGGRWRVEGIGIQGGGGGGGVGGEFEVEGVGEGGSQPLPSSSSPH